MKTEYRQYIFIALLFALVIVSGVNYFFKPFRKEIISKVTTEIVKVIPEKKIVTPRDIVNDLTPSQKIAQMIAFPVLIDEKSETDLLKEYQTSSTSLQIVPGFVTIFGNDIASDSAKERIKNINGEYPGRTLPIKFIVDHEGGAVQRLSGDGYTRLPSWKEVCKLTPKDRTKILRQSAKELSETGINIVLAPVLDVGKSSALSERICSDSYPIVADRSLDFTTAFNAFDILPVLKHFPGIGTVNNDLHYSFSSVSVDTNDVKLYKYVVEQSSRVGAMISHVGVENQDPLVPCSLSKACVGELKTAYPDMLIFSDALDMDSAAYNKEIPKLPKELDQVSQEAVEAGNEVLVYGKGLTLEELDLITNRLITEYDSSNEFKSLVDNAVLKIVEYKQLK